MSLNPQEAKCEVKISENRVLQLSELLPFDWKSAK